MKQAKTTLNYKGKNYPFYRTNRGQWDFEGAGFSTDGLVNGNQRDLIALAFFTVRACAQKAGLPWTDSLEDFVDNTDPDVINVFNELKKEQDNITKELNGVPGKPKAQGPEKS